MLQAIPPDRSRLSTSHLPEPPVKTFQSVMTIGLLLLSTTASAGDGLAEHPLLRGVQSPEAQNPYWPSVLHDKLTTGFSPLRCNMREAPTLWCTIQLGGKASAAAFVEAPGRKPFLLLQDSRLRRVDAAGKVAWELPSATPCFFDRLQGDERYTLGVLQGNTLLLVDPQSGKPYWRHTFEGSLGVEKVRVARMLPDWAGKQIAVFPQYFNVGYLFGFPKGGREPV